LSTVVIKEHLCENLRDRHLMLFQVGGDPPTGYPTGGVWMDEVGQEWMFEDNKDKDDFNITKNNIEDFFDIYHNVNEQFMDPLHDI
jgi:hypothetical protein